MSQAKANSQNIYAILAVMDVRIRNLKPGPGKFERRILILAFRMTLRSCLDIFQGFCWWGKGTGGTPMSSMSPLINLKIAHPPIFVDHDKNFYRYFFNFCMTKANLTSIYNKFKDANFTVLLKY